MINDKFLRLRQEPSVAPASVPLATIVGGQTHMRHVTGALWGGDGTYGCVLSHLVVSARLYCILSVHHEAWQVVSPTGGISFVTCTVLSPANFEPPSSGHLIHIQHVAHTARCL
jgi:hypothetical protein